MKDPKDIAIMIARKNAKKGAPESIMEDKEMDDKEGLNVAAEEILAAIEEKDPERLKEQCAEYACDQQSVDDGFDRLPYGISGFDVLGHTALRSLVCWGATCGAQRG